MSDYNVYDHLRASEVNCRHAKQYTKERQRYEIQQWNIAAEPRAMKTPFGR